MPGSTFCLPSGGLPLPSPAFLPSSAPTQAPAAEAEDLCVFFIQVSPFCSVLLKVCVNCLFLNEYYFKSLLLKNQ